MPGFYPRFAESGCLGKNVPLSKIPGESLDPVKSESPALVCAERLLPLQKQGHQSLFWNVGSWTGFWNRKRTLVGNCLKSEKHQ